MNFITNYIASPTHKWWVDNVWHPTYTKLATALYGIPSALLVAVQYVSKAAGDDKITGLMQQMHVPDGIFMGLAGVALFHYVLSGHKED